MKCAICHREITRTEADSGQYITSKFTGDRYHSRPCDTKRLKRERLEATREEREAKAKERAEKLERGVKKQRAKLRV